MKVIANDLVATVNSHFELAVGFSSRQPTAHDYRKKHGDRGTTFTITLPVSISTS